MKEDEYRGLLDGIFERFPSVQNVGFSGDAYKPGLEHMVRFLELLGNPQRRYRTVHVAGTNGKGSVCHMLVSALAATGCKTGLYTSPHILDFRERMRIVEDSHFDLVPKEYVYGFLKRWSQTFDRLQLSFFEITTAMAFDWFAEAGVDVAVIEVGLGGRLDSTNVIMPELSVITSIGLDHCALLGDTLEEVAFEKAGIIKPSVPVVIGEFRPETAPVFRRAAAERGAPIFFTPSDPPVMSTVPPVMSSEAETSQIHLDLRGAYQKANLRTVLTALQVLGCDPGPQVLDAIAHTARRTGLRGRWEHLCEDPLVICDIGHNAHALQHNFAQLESMMASGVYDCLIIVYAVMADKDLGAILPLMPRMARYIFTAPKGKRPLPAVELKERFLDYARNDKRNAWNDRGSGKQGAGYPPKPIDPYYNRVLGDTLHPAPSKEHPSAPLAVEDVGEAVKKALEEASAYRKPLIYIGGSTFAVAEAKPLFQK